MSTTPQKGRAPRVDKRASVISKDPNSGKTTKEKARQPASSPGCLLALFDPGAARANKPEQRWDNLLTVFEPDAANKIAPSKKRKQEAQTNGDSNDRSDIMLKQRATHQETQKKISPKEKPSTRPRKQRTRPTPALDDKASGDDSQYNNNSTRVSAKLKWAAQQEIQKKRPPKKTPLSGGPRKQQRGLDPAQSNQASENASQHDDSNTTFNAKSKRAIQQEFQRTTSPKMNLSRSSSSSSSGPRIKQRGLETTPDNKASDDDPPHDYNNTTDNAIRQAPKKTLSPKMKLSRNSTSSSGPRVKQREPALDDKASEDDPPHDDNNTSINFKAKRTIQQAAPKSMLPKMNLLRSSSGGGGGPRIQQRGLEPALDDKASEDDPPYDDNNSHFNVRLKQAIQQAPQKTPLPKKNILRSSSSSSSSPCIQQPGLEPARDDEANEDIMIHDEEELLSFSEEMARGSSKEVTDASVKLDSFPFGASDVTVGEQVRKGMRASPGVATQSKNQTLSTTNSIDSPVIVDRQIDSRNKEGKESDVQSKRSATNDSIDNFAAMQQNKKPEVDASSFEEQIDAVGTSTNQTGLLADSPPCRTIPAVEELAHQVLTEKSGDRISAECVSRYENATSLPHVLHTIEGGTALANMPGAASSRLVFKGHDIQERNEAEDFSSTAEKLPTGVGHEGRAGAGSCSNNHNKSLSDNITDDDIVVSETVGLKLKANDSNASTRIRRSQRERRPVERLFMARGVGADEDVGTTAPSVGKKNGQSVHCRKDDNIPLHGDPSNPERNQRLPLSDESKLHTSSMRSKIARKTLQDASERVERKTSNAARSNGTKGKRATALDARGRRLMKPYKKASPEIPVAPSDVDSIWSFNEETRVLLADFRNVGSITTKEKKHLLRMMERDDICVVSWGLVPSVEISDASLEDIACQVEKDSRFHNFRRFDRVTESGESYFKEVGLLTMNFGDFQEYLRLKKEFPSKSYEFTEREQNTVVRFDKVDDVVLYLTDVEMDRYVPLLNNDYKNAFKVSEILPGGEFCMTEAVPCPARPFMGPYLCLASGGFTSFRQVGHGTVDSGHTCMSGFNEVVMLRRLPEEHKQHALSCLPFHGQHDLYNSPRESQKVDREIWPTNETVYEWKQMNYCPSVFILEPGQHLHINKGRLYCLRILTPDRLRLDDCHAGLRHNLIQELRPKPSDYRCLSISFYWMFLGITEKGIKEEVRSCLECTELCRTHKPEPLKYIAIPETALLQIASRLTEPVETDPFLLPGVIVPAPLNVCKGILTSLKTVVGREVANSKVKTTRAPQPDAHESPDTSPIDPFGSDYVCRMCHAELSNSYFHCCGCEDLLAQDMNICLSCYEAGLYYQNVSMAIHSINDTWVSDINHTGENNKKRKTKFCKCRQGLCKKCGFCKSCSCRCHHHFQLNQRFYTLEQIEEDLHRIEGFVEQAEKHFSYVGAFVEELEDCLDIDHEK